MENRSLLWRSRPLCILSLLGFAFSLQASTITDDVTVLGTTMPWQYNTTTFNSSYQFGLGDGTGPIVINALSGISFAPAGTLVITFLNPTPCPANCVSVDQFGSIPLQPGVSSPYEDARGYTPSTPIPYITNTNPGTSGKDFPSFYMNPANYPIYLGALVGVFADSSGDIVGTPFVINDGPTDAVIPVGATQLQLGVNDDMFFDNAGSYSVQVQGLDPTPEPGSFLLIGFPLVALGAFEYRRRAAKARA